MEQEISLKDIISIAKRRYWFFVIPFVLLAAGSVALAVLLPPQYQSTGVILIESPKISGNIVSASVDGAATERIEVIKQRVMTRSNLLNLAKEYNVFRWSNGELSSTEMVQQMRALTTVELVNTGTSRNQTTIAFRISFDHRSPIVAVKVTNELVTLFMEENVKTRTKIATETTEFLNQEAAKLEKTLSEIENSIAIYKQENSDALPENLDLRMSMRERVETGMREIDREVKSYEEELRFLDIQLNSARAEAQQVSLVSAAAAAPQQPQGLPTEATTSPEEAQYVELLASLSAAEAVYAPSHPDVKALKREIKATTARLIAEGSPFGRQLRLEQIEAALASANGELGQAERDELAAEAATLRSANEPVVVEAPSAPTIDPNAGLLSSINLNISSIAVKINIAKERILSLRQQKETLGGQLEEIENAILQAPQVDRALRALNRDYENALSKYNDVRAKAMEAQISENVEEASKAERFVLVEPPTVPTEPVKPDRKKLLGMGLALSFALGAASIVGIEFLDGGIRGALALENLTHIAPLVSVPYITTHQEVRSNTRKRYLLVTGLLMLGVLGTVMVHFFYMPIDQLFYKISDRFL